jgi:hypothetical protein
MAMVGIPTVKVAPVTDAAFVPDVRLATARPATVAPTAIPATISRIFLLPPPLEMEPAGESAAEGSNLRVETMDARSESLAAVMRI